MSARHPRTLLTLACAVLLSLTPAALAQTQPQPAPPGESPALGERLTLDEVRDLGLKQLRREGMRIFTTRFNTYDGLGDGPMDHADPSQPGGRPTLQGNGTFLRLNGLDSQTCVECHSIVSNATSPPTFGVGGVGGVSANAMAGLLDPDVDDTDGAGFASIRGRFINPPFNFGLGGIELLAREMTAELQALAASAEAQPGVEVPLVTKGISFGSVVFADGVLDRSGIQGVDDDLVIRPFGRKGSFPTVRAFDVDATQFHFGMQAVEVVGEHVDADGDGVVNELTVGEISALHAFQVLLERPRQVKPPNGGLELFEATGCATCHVPALTTNSETHDLIFPDDPSDPRAEVYRTVKLSGKPARFSRSGDGIEVPLFADLKRHDMGPGLAESTGDPLDAFFTTARLWGVADTAPYMHDGRAGTLTEAILMHGGEAQAARDAFDVLPDDDRRLMIDFLRSLQTPRKATRGL